MDYKDYTITAEVQSYDKWTIDSNGKPSEWIEGLDGIEVTGYHFDHEDSTKSFFQAMSETDRTTLKCLVDDHIKELAEAEKLAVYKASKL